MKINLSKETIKRIIKNLRTFHIRGMHTIEKSNKLMEDIEMFEKMLETIKL